MVRKKGVIGAIMVAVLLIGATGTAFAAPESADSLDDAINKGTDALSDAQDEKKQLQSNLSAAQAMKKELENAKTALTGDVVELDSQMSEVSNDLLEVQNLLDTKEAELEKTTKELAQAKIDVEKQYEDMKLRIKFMYENGTMSYIQILLSSGSFSELLNKAEYIEQVSEYDRNMLQTYQDNLTRLEKDLKDQKEVLEQVKGDVEAKQTEMAGLISDKQTEIEGYESDIQNKEEAIKEYEAMIAEQDSTIKALEASVAAAKAKRTQMTVSDNSTNAADQPHYGGGAFVWPAPSYTRISDDYGYRTHPILGIQKFHSGVDMAAPSGSSILAAADGTVVAATYNATMGNYVMIDHGNGLYTIYMHASALYVSSGQSVSAGSTIAAVGSTGRSTGAHLHFSVRQNGNYVSPWNYL